MELNPYTVILQIINFLVLVAILGRFLFRPVMAMLDQRQTQVEMDLDQAAQTREQAERFHREREQALAEANQRVENLLKEAAERAEQLQADAVLKAESMTKRLISEAEARLRREQEQAREALRQELARLAVGIAGKVLPKALNYEQQQRLLDQAIHEVGNDGC